MENQQGHGLIEAPRGALGHGVNVKDNKILSYQIITPTAWNASPRDADDVRGPLEEALIEIKDRNPENPSAIINLLREFGRKPDFKKEHVNINGVIKAA